ncbi:MAG: sugar O-acetyltransferase [Ruminococcus sp.]|nr:sugar O-acetyltransferase [Ruminococcus sp.]
MTEKERMLSGKLYNALDSELRKDMRDCKYKLSKFNNMLMDETAERTETLREILGGSGEWLYIEPPFYCDYGKNIFVGDSFYANYNLHILDCARVTIGNNVLIGPMCGIYTAGHPIDSEVRNTGLEFSKEIKIGDNVWIGGNVTINPGVTIGSNVVIGSGSVVTSDIPDNCIAFGNPCKVHREITDDDKKYWKEEHRKYIEEIENNN